MNIKARYHKWLTECEEYDKKQKQYCLRNQHMAGTTMRTERESVKEFGWTALILSVLFIIMWFPMVTNWDLVQFNNDTPVGNLAADSVQLPGAFFGIWQDLNWLGKSEVVYPLLCPSGIFRLACWYPNTSLIIIGFVAAIGTWWWRRKKS